MESATQEIRRRQAGYALPAATIIAFALVLIGASFFAIAGYETKASQTDLASQRAFWLAEAGRERGLRKMVADYTGFPPGEDTNLYSNEPGPAYPTPPSPAPPPGTYTVDCLVDPAGANAVEKRFVLDCVGVSGGVQRRIRDHIKMTCFAQYAYFTDAEQEPGGDEIWFITADRIHGAVHTNGTFHINGSPHFYDKVTSASNRMIGAPNYSVTAPSGWPVGGNNPIFDRSFQLNVGTIPLPTQTLDLKNQALTGGRYVAPASTIQLGKRGTTAAGTDARGWLRYRNTSPSSSPWAEVQISALTKKVLYVNDATELSGRLGGELTIASRTNIRIIDDVTYWDSDAGGTPPPGCPDMLGLVAGNNIRFADIPPTTSNLKVNAVLMALNTSIEAENVDTRSACGTLTIWGGLIQKYRGIVCKFDSSGNIVHGYAKDYHYDERVTSRPPPAFPLTGVYEEVAWSETWDASPPF
jgi:hypothetical protein